MLIRRGTNPNHMQCQIQAWSGFAQPLHRGWKSDGLMPTHRQRLLSILERIPGSRDTVRVRIRGKVGLRVGVELELGTKSHLANNPHALHLLICCVNPALIYARKNHLWGMVIVGCEAREQLD